MCAKEIEEGEVRRERKKEEDDKAVIGKIHIFTLSPINIPL